MPGIRPISAVRDRTSIKGTAGSTHVSLTGASNNGGVSVIRRLLWRYDRHFRTYNRGPVRPLGGPVSGWARRTSPSCADRLRSAASSPHDVQSVLIYSTTDRRGECHVTATPCNSRERALCRRGQRNAFHEFERATRVNINDIYSRDIAADPVISKRLCAFDQVLAARLALRVGSPRPIVTG